MEQDSIDAMQNADMSAATEHEHAPSAPEANICIKCGEFTDEKCDCGNFFCQDCAAMPEIRKCPMCEMHYDDQTVCPSCNCECIPCCPKCK